MSEVTLDANEKSRFMEWNVNTSDSQSLSSGAVFGSKRRCSFSRFGFSTFQVLADITTPPTEGDRCWQTSWAKCMFIINIPVTGNFVVFVFLLCCYRKCSLKNMKMIPNTKIGCRGFRLCLKGPNHGNKSVQRALPMLYSNTSSSLVWAHCAFIPKCLPGGQPVGFPCCAMGRWAAGWYSRGCQGARRSMFLSQPPWPEKWAQPRSLSECCLFCLFVFLQAWNTVCAILGQRISVQGESGEERGDTAGLSFLFKYTSKWQLHSLCSYSTHGSDWARRRREA